MIFRKKRFSNRSGRRVALPLESMEDIVLLAVPVDLGGINQHIQSVTGVNSSGMVIGQEPPPGGLSGANTAFLIGSGGLAPINATSGYTSSFANGINTGGVVAGYFAMNGSSGGISDSVTQAVIYNGSSHPLGFLDTGTLSIATGINDSGDAVGNATTNSSSNSNVAFFYDNNAQQKTGLGTLGGTQSFATGINATDAITGYIISGQGGAGTVTQAFYLASPKAIPMLLGYLPSSTPYSKATAINANKEVVGFSQLSATFSSDEAFKWTGGTIQGIGSLQAGGESEAYAINSSGQIVGNSTYSGNTLGSGQTHAFIYDTDGVMYDLNSSKYLTPGTDWVLETATGISDNYIVGMGSYNNQQVAYRLALPAGPIGSVQTATNLQPNTQTTTYGQNITFTATVTSATATPSGTVTFSYGSGSQIVSLQNGTAQLTLSTLPAGADTVTAYYDGNSMYDISSDTASVSVAKATPSVSVSAPANTSYSGTTIVFTAKISPAPPPGGNEMVTFEDNGKPIATAPVNGNTATYSTSSLIAGLHSIMAVYGGDSNLFPATSSPWAETISPPGPTPLPLPTPTTELKVSPKSSKPGQRVTFTVTVSASLGFSGKPTGTIKFIVDGIVFTSKSLVRGKATLNTSHLSVGPNTIQAKYDGNPAFNVSYSNRVAAIVKPKKAKHSAKKAR